MVDPDELANFARRHLPAVGACVGVVGDEDIKVALFRSDLTLVRLTGIASLTQPESLDAVVIENATDPRISLLDGVEALATSVRPHGALILNGFALDLLDESTAEWFYDQRRDLAAEGRGPDVHSTLDGFRSWLTDTVFAGAPTHHELRYALYESFEELSFEWRPGLYDYLDSEESLPMERWLISLGKIRALGFLYAGRRRAATQSGPADSLVA
ncbi:MAG: hypothetical protein ACXVY3_07785 [Gaiellaceae bacterium]